MTQKFLLFETKGSRRRINYKCKALLPDKGTKNITRNQKIHNVRRFLTKNFSCNLPLKILASDE